MWKRHAADAHNVAPREDLGKVAMAAAHMKIPKGGVATVLSATLAFEAAKQLESVYNLDVKASRKLVNDIADALTERPDRALDEEVRLLMLVDKTTVGEEYGEDSTAMELFTNFSVSFRDSEKACDDTLSEVVDRNALLFGKLEMVQHGIDKTLSALDKAQASADSLLGSDSREARDIGAQMKSDIKRIQGELRQVQRSQPVVKNDVREIRQTVDNVRAERVRERRERGPTGGDHKQEWLDAMASLATGVTMRDIVNDLTEFVDDKWFEAAAPSGLKHDLEDVAVLHGLAVQRAHDQIRYEPSYDMRQLVKMLRAMYVALFHLKDLLGANAQKLGSGEGVGKWLRAVFSTMLGIEYIAAFEYYTAKKQLPPAERIIHHTGDPTGNRERVWDDVVWYKKEWVGAKGGMVASPLAGGFLDDMRDAVDAVYEMEPWDADLP